MIKWALFLIGLTGFAVGLDYKLSMIYIVGSLVCQHIDNRLKK